MDQRADAGDGQPRMPGGVVVVLHAPGHAHQADNIERHEREMEPDEPAPERAPAPALVEREPNAFGNQYV